MDYNLYGMNMINVAAAKFRRPPDAGKYRSLTLSDTLVNISFSPSSHILFCIAKVLFSSCLST